MLENGHDYFIEQTDFACIASNLEYIEKYTLRTYVSAFKQTKARISNGILVLNARKSVSATSFNFKGDVENFSTTSSNTKANLSKFFYLFGLMRSVCEFVIYSSVYSFITIDNLISIDKE